MDLLDQCHIDYLDISVKNILIEEFDWTVFSQL